MAKIIGNTTATPNPRPDWNQTDSTKADYIKNKPELGALAAKNKITNADLSTDVLEGLATETYVDNKVASMVDSAPETLNTLNELANALGDDPNFATTVATQIGQKADKTSVEDVIRYTEQTLTNEQKAQVRANIGAMSTGEVPDVSYVQSNWTETNTDSNAYIINKPTIQAGTGKFSVVESTPSSNIASGGYSHAEGSQTKAYGDQSHAEGFGSTASGKWSHAEGLQTIAEGDFSHVEGKQTKVLREGGHAEGKYSQAIGYYAHAEGSGSQAYGRAHAEGYQTKAIGDNAHSEGAKTVASGWYGAHAEGGSTIASGNASHAEGGHWKEFERDPETLEGNGNLISAGGSGTIASGNAAHAEGIGCISSGLASHAQGFVTQATKAGSFSGGMASITKYSNKITLTRLDDDVGTATFILDIIGDEPTLNVGDYISLSTADNTIVHLVHQITGVNGNEYTTSATSSIEADKTFIIAKLVPTKATGESAIAFGNECDASGNCSISIGLKNKTTAKTSVALGSECVSSGESAIAIGFRNQALFHSAFAEGCRTVAGDSAAKAYSCHAEGQDTQAIADVSHAEGRNTLASGRFSHAEGRDTVAQGWAQHVQGKWNIIDISQDANSNALGKYAHIVGNGTSNTKRSNAHTLDWSGNAWYAGSITMNENQTLKTKTLTIEYTDGSTETVQMVVV